MIRTEEIVEALRDARKSVYCYEQQLLALCREPAAKIQTKRLLRIDDLLRRTETEGIK